jgi:putative FmdB family regulatory protein
MPIYEYRCQQCGGEFEYMQRMADDPKTTCERCAGTLERMISRSAFHLKGSGWYKDLYSSAKPASGVAESKAGESKAGESKVGESKAGESKSKETKSAEPKPAKSSSSAGGD